MNLNWGTIIASAISAIGVWFITNAWLSPWLERKKRLADEKRKHEMRLVACHECGGVEVPYWFASRPAEVPLNFTVWGTCICRYHDALEPRVALPYEDEAIYRKAIKVEAKAAKKALKAKKA